MLKYIGTKTGRMQGSFVHKAQLNEKLRDRAQGLHDRVSDIQELKDNEEGPRKVHRKQA